MRDFIATYLENKGYDVNDKAQGIIKECDDWYANRVIEDFHKRTTVHGTQFEFNRMGFAKRCCADDANLCEVAEVNGGIYYLNLRNRKIIRQLLILHIRKM